MQIFITVSIKKVPQIYQIELSFEDLLVHGYIYTELIKTLVYISFQCQLCYYHTSCRIENFLGNVWVYKHAKQCFDLQVHINGK